MTPSTSVNSNPGAAPDSHEQPLEQWLRTEHVAGKMKCYGILGPVITGQQGRFIQPVCSSRGQSQAVQMDVRPNQTPTLLSLQLTRQLHHGHIWKGVFRKELLALQWKEGRPAAQTPWDRQELQDVEGARALTPGSFCLGPGQRLGGQPQSKLPRAEPNACLLP